MTTYHGDRCPSGHTERYAVSGTCVTCQRARNQARRDRGAKLLRGYVGVVSALGRRLEATARDDMRAWVAAQRALVGPDAAGDG